MEDSVPDFATEKEATEFFKNLANEYKKRLSEMQQELEEFQDGSKELESELEIQLEQLEVKNKDLTTANSRLKIECERLQTKLDNCQMESSETISSLQDELKETKLVKDDLQNYVRKLEQKNDDFERATRASLMSLEDFESRLNQAIERNAFLENELDEKENMAVLIQRLKDEARDLKQELLVHDLPKSKEVPPSPTRNQSNIIDTNKINSEIEIANRNRIRRSNIRPSYISNASSTVPHSALNIVGDLLKKVGVLESKLQSCRDCIKDSSDHIVGEKRTNVALTSPRVRLVKGSQLSSPKDCIPLTA